MYAIENLRVLRLSNIVHRLSLEQTTDSDSVTFKTNGPTFEFTADQLQQLKMLVDIDQSVWNCALFLKANFLLEDHNKKEMLVTLLDSWHQK